MTAINEVEIRDFLIDRLTSNNFKLFKNIRIKDTDVQFECLIENPNHRIIFIIEIIGEDDIYNTLKRINAKLNTLKQILMLNDHEKMIILVLIISCDKQHVLQEVEEYRLIKDFYRKIIINSAEISPSKPSYEYYLKTIIPLTLAIEDSVNIISEKPTKEFLDEFILKNRIIRSILDSQIKEPQDFESVITYLLGRI